MLGEAIILADLEGKIILSDPMAESLYGYQQLEMAFLTFHDLVAPNLRVAIDQMLRLAINERTDITMIHQRKDGSTFTAIVRPMLLTGMDESYVLLFIKADSVAADGRRDPLTGCLCREDFISRLHSLDGSMAEITVVVIDVNGLRLINDACGLAAGDVLLAVVADHIRALIPRDETPARIDGDEFAVCLVGPASGDADQLAQQIKNLPFVPGIGAGTTLSVGLATGLAGRDRPLDILRAAEDQLLRDKLFEKNSVLNFLTTPIWQSLYEKSPEDEGHARRIQKYAETVGRKLGLSAAEIRDLALIALLHDIGKIVVPNSILDKPGALTEEEWTIVKRHPDIGFRIIKTVSFLGSVAEGILAHHERWDGQGYPYGLAGRAIPLLSRIVSVADSFDVMITGRPYKPAMSLAQATRELRRCSGTQFDPEVVEAFVQAVISQPRTGWRSRWFQSGK